MGKMSDVFKINGKAILSPQSANVVYESLADANSGRTDDGVMHINYIYNRIRRVEFTYPPLTQEEIRELADLVQGKEYDLTYLDPIDGIKTIHVYTSTSNCGLYNLFLYNGLWTGFKFNAIELEGELT